MSGESEAEADAQAESAEPTRSIAGLRVAAVAVTGAAILVCVWTAREIRMRQSVPAPHASAPDPAQALQMEAFTGLQSVSDRVRSAWREHGTPPTSLLGLPPDDENPQPPAGAAADPPVDLWGRPYLVETLVTPEGPGLRVHTLGADGRPGGTGADADLATDIGNPSKD